MLEIKVRDRFSFLQGAHPLSKRLDEKMKGRPSWQGRTILDPLQCNLLHSFRNRLNLFFDRLLEELEPCRRIKEVVSFEGRKVRCGSREIPFQEGGNIIIVGAGKVSHQMAQALFEVVGERAQGVVAVHRDLGKREPLGHILFQPSGHPNPDEGSITAARGILGLLDSVRGHDIVFSLISGGASAMMELPVPAVSLRDYIITNELLNRAGFSIEEWNTVRKHLSQVKGGRLAQRAAKAGWVFNLMISDVVGDRPDIIASGPFVADPSTFEEAYQVLSKLCQKIQVLGRNVPSSVLNYIGSNVGLAERETPKVVPPQVENCIILNNREAIEFIAEWLATEGITVPDSQRLTNISGDIEEATCEIYSLLAWAVSLNPSKPTAVIAGGEATVDVTRYPAYREGRSFGGRMQMMAALMIDLIEGLPVVGLFAATDCRDGEPPPGRPGVAGALIDGTTLRMAMEKGIVPAHYVEACNTYELHQRLSTQLHKGRFVTNVMDVAVLVYLPMG